jgi:segregation and condensation protein B
MNFKALVEAALFISDKPLSIQQLSKLTGLKENELKSILRRISQELLKEDRGIELVETPIGFEFRVKKEYREKVSILAPLADLSDGMMRTLSIVVLNQPIKQSDIVKFQGNKAYGYIKSLEERGIIKTQKHGRTKLVTVSSDFERYFGKNVEEVKEILRRKVEKV